VNATPPGWYPDPQNPQASRYWDGVQWAEGEPRAVAMAPQPALPVAAVDPYSRMFDVAALPPEQREALKHHQLSEFPAWAVVVLSIFTLGLFGLIFHGLKHSYLPHVKHDDFTAGKAIGFSFIPFFGIYWLFVMWPRLADRINFQYRLRGQPEPVSKDVILWANITWVAGALVAITWLAAPVLACIAAAQIQSAANRLASGELDAQPALPA
jgi:hypothetical protein